jgi:hypothetical protein
MNGTGPADRVLVLGGEGSVGPGALDVVVVGGGPADAFPTWAWDYLDRPPAAPRRKVPTRGQP